MIRNCKKCGFANNSNPELVGTCSECGSDLECDYPDGRIACRATVKLEVARSLIKEAAELLKEIGRHDEAGRAEKILTEADALHIQIALDVWPI